MLLITIGYTFFFYLKKKDENLQDKNNSPIQLISQLKGYFYIKPILAISLTITLYSFVGVPPLIGFFAKQMVLTAAIDNGYIFMALIAILTSVISAVYYLAIVKQIFFDKPEENINDELNQLNLSGYIYTNSNKKQKDILNSYNLTSNLNLSSILSKEKNTNNLDITNIISNSSKINFGIENIVLSSSLTLIISSLTMIIIGFMFDPAQLINTSSILAIILFNI
jgi:NADH-ubiquinone oxidoreductase chain 2